MFSEPSVPSSIEFRETCFSALLLECRPSGRPKSSLKCIQRRTATLPRMSFSNSTVARASGGSVTKAMTTNGKLQSTVELRTRQDVRAVPARRSLLRTHSLQWTLTSLRNGTRRRMAMRHPKPPSMECTRRCGGNVQMDLIMNGKRWWAIELRPARMDVRAVPVRSSPLRTHSLQWVPMSLHNGTRRRMAMRHPNPLSMELTRRRGGSVQMDLIMNGKRQWTVELRLISQDVRAVPAGSSLLRTHSLQWAPTSLRNGTRQKMAMRHPKPLSMDRTRRCGGSVQMDLIMNGKRQWTVELRRTRQDVRTASTRRSP